MKPESTFEAKNPLKENHYRPRESGFICRLHDERFREIFPGEWACRSCTYELVSDYTPEAYRKVGLL